MCSGCEWQDFLGELDEAIGDDAFEWASETISGIYETVEDRGHVTERQKEAFMNISDAVKRRRR